MSKKVEVEIMFWRKVKYSGTISVNAADFELLEEHEGNDIPQYGKPKGSFTTNPVYELIQELATESNECDWAEELEDLEVNSYYKIDEN